MIALVRRAFRADRWLTLAFLALLTATVLPFWIGRYLPLLDIPNHLSAIAVWHHHQDPRFDFSQHYALNLSPLPYWAHYYLCHLLAYVVDVEAANKLFLTAYALALPSGALLLARRFQRSPWLSLFAFPLVWNFNLAEGFIAYVAGMAATVLALVVVDRHAERPSWLRALFVLVIGSSIYFFHLLTYLFFLVCGGLLVFAQRRAFDVRRVLQRGLPVLGCALIGLWAYRHNSTMGFASIEGGTQFVIDPWSYTLTNVPRRLLNVLASDRDEWVVLVLVAAWLALAITAARQRHLQPREPFSGRALGIEVCLFVAAAAILMLPRSMQRPFNWYMINGRFVPLAALFAALLIRGPVAGWRRWLFVPVVAAGLFYAADLCRMMVAFNRRTAGFDQLVAQIPLHKNTLTLVFPPLGDPEVNVNCFNQWASYTQIRRGGYNFYNFNYGFPLRYLKYKPAPQWNHTEYFNWDLHGRAWDYFVTHNEGKKHDVFGPLAREGKVRLVDRSGDWILWERIEKP